MFDQLMALQWVKDNIEQFGENVKIFLMSANSIIIIIIIISIYLLILMSTSFEHFSTLFKKLLTPPPSSGHLDCKFFDKLFKKHVNVIGKITAPPVYD